MLRSNRNTGLGDYKHLFDRLYPPLCLFANRYVANMDLSKDIVQEAFIKIWEKQLECSNHNGIKSYLYTTVRNMCLNHLKSRLYKVGRDSSPIDLALLESEEHFLAEIVTVETYANLERAIGTLPNKASKVMQLALNDYTTKEIAEELSVTPSTVRTQKQIAYERLRKILSLK